MADYKLSELNSIDTIRSDDLLHVRVKKRPEMLGDEDRRMTYQDFLASFKLERFVQIAGSTMTGDLGIVKLLYGGKAVFDPTGSSEITIGDVLKTFKINANGLRLTIADASRSATVYHTLNKPSPNELGMRTNEENDARYARLAITNTFSGTQNIQGDANLLRLRNRNANNAQYIEGVNLDGSARWWVGIGSNGSDEVKLYNNKYNSVLTVASNISVNKSLAITGQVQPSDFSNLDARYFTQTAANQRFAQLAGNNTFSGSNIFTNFVIKKNANAITIQNVDTTAALYIQARKSDGTNKWYIGNDGDENIVNIYNYLAKTKISLGKTITMSRTVQIGGQVQPSDWSNIDGRYYNKSSADNRYLRVRSTGFNTNGVTKWAKIATVTMPQATSTAVIELFGGSGFNYNTPDQACKTEIVIRAGNGKPKGLNVVAWKNSPNGVVMEIGYVNTSGDNYDIYCKAGNYQNATTARVQSSDNATVQLFETPETSDSAPSDYVAGTIAYYYTSLLKPTPSDIGAYTKAETDQKIAQAVSDSTDLNKIYPVGIVTWFNSNVDPNTALPGLTWTYLNNGVGRTIRIAAANGSDVATTGGSDSVTLAVGNLPSHTHSFSATTSSFDYGTKGTNSTGGHTHSVSGTTSAAGNHAHHLGLLLVNGGDALYGYTTVGNNKTRTLDWLDRTDNKFPNTNTTGNHTHTWSGTTSGAGDHSHSVGIGAHSHTVSGNTGGTGSGSAFSVTNQFYKLMAWVRTA